MKWAFLLLFPALAQGQIVKVVCTAPDGTTMYGTGVIHGSLQAGDQLHVGIQTAEHVVATAGKVTVIVDGVKVPCSIMTTNHDLDLALLHISACPVPVKEITMAKRAFRHSKVTAKNFDGKTASGTILEIGSRELKVNEGIRLKGRMIETDAPIVQGFSGGPILNEDGELVGISLASAKTSYGVDVMEIRGFLAAYSEKVMRDRGYLK